VLIGWLASALATQVLLAPLTVRAMESGLVLGKKRSDPFRTNNQLFVQRQAHNAMTALCNPYFTATMHLMFPSDGQDGRPHPQPDSLNGMN
jgi:hypothetical protein